MSIKSLYLILYNIIQLLGWSFFFLKVTNDLIISKSIEEIYLNSHKILEFCQYGAFLEIIHSFIGIVNSSFFITSIQIIGRILIVIILQFFQNAISKGYLLIYFAWSLVEIIRYTYYILSLFQKEINIFNIPYIIIWCRYSFFIILYPIGISGEMITVWNAKKDFNKYIIYQNDKYTFTVANLIYPIWILYIPALIFLYSYLFKQRKKVLNRLNIKDKDIKIKKNK